MVTRLGWTYLDTWSMKRVYRLEQQNFLFLWIDMIEIIICSRYGVGPIKLLLTH